jgi:hypothetical protein
MKRLPTVLFGLFLLACADVDEVALPPEAALLSSQLTFLRFDDAAFQAAEKSGRFWAVRGEARSLTLRYADTGEPFLHFDVGEHSLVDRDSVEISVQVDDSGQLTFHFEPSGLRFNDLAPARLRIDFERADRDINADGDVDLFDTLLALQAGIWKRELPILPWVKLPSLNLLGSVQQTNVYDFTSFGMAVD